MTWTSERVSELKRMHADGYSASQIARLLGGCTRNAVLGKLYRLGLCKPTGLKAKLRPRLKLKQATVDVEPDAYAERGADLVMAP